MGDRTATRRRVEGLSGDDRQMKNLPTETSPAAPVVPADVQLPEITLKAVPHGRQTFRIDLA